MFFVGANATPNDYFAFPLTKAKLIVQELLHERQSSNEKEKPFTCPECNRNFNLRHHLQNHLLIHTGEKLFICGKCGQAFRKKWTLTRHITACRL